MLLHNMSKHTRDRLAIVSPWIFPNGSVNLPAVKTKFRYKVNSQRFLQEERIPVHISYSDRCIPSPPLAATSHFCCYLSSHELMKSIQSHESAHLLEARHDGGWMLCTVLLVIFCYKFQFVYIS